MTDKVLIIGGATATDKTKLAVKVAQKFPSVLINADSMQFYQDLSLLSNRPLNDDFRKIENKLFGVLQLPDTPNLGWWSKQVKAEIRRAHHKRKIPIIVGGTGLYLSSIEKKISFIPEIDNRVKEKINEIYELKGLNYLYQRLKNKDLETYKNLNANDKYRIFRALEVKLSTGKNINYWKKIDNNNHLYKDYTFVILKKNRSLLYKNINERFNCMVRKGVIEQVKDFMKKKVSVKHPINKMIGLKYIKRFILGELKLSEAIRLSQRDTRRYAKRQITWFTHQPRNAKYFNFSEACDYLIKN